MAKRIRIIAAASAALCLALLTGCETTDTPSLKRKDVMVDIVTNETVRRLGYSIPNKTFNKINSSSRPYDKQGIEFWVYDLKLNLVAASIRGIKVEKALADLSFSKRRIAGDVKKALQSAIANAENNHQLDVDSLYVKEAFVGKAMVLKRFRARARGRVERGEDVHHRIDRSLIGIETAAGAGHRVAVDRGLVHPP